MTLAESMPLDTWLAVVALWLMLLAFTSIMLWESGKRYDDPEGSDDR